MLDLADITLTYPDGDATLTALDHVDLHVTAGDFTAVTGPSGSGKSSLLAVAATLVAPDSGTLEIDGERIDARRRRRASEVRRRLLGIVFQSPNLIPSLTVREQLEVVVRLAGLRGRERAAAEARIDELLDRVGLASMSARRPAQLSGGQRQRVNIARALVHQPKALLVDEPTSALDRSRGDEVIEVLRELTHERELATVVVTHEHEQLPRFDRVTDMLDGVLTEREAALAGEDQRMAAIATAERRASRRLAS